MTEDQAIEYFSPDLKLNLGSLFISNRERAEFTLQFYRSLYALPTLFFDDHVTNELFEYCKRRLFFVEILAFQDRRVFLKRALHERLLWELPGSSVRSEGTELFEDSVARILQTDVPGIEMSELCPIAHLRKCYHFGEESFTHHGLAFLGRVRSPSYAEIQCDENIKGRFVSLSEIPERERLSKFEQMLVSLGVQMLSHLPNTNYEAVDQEIVSTDSISHQATFIHDHAVRPFGRLFSSNLIKREILKYVDNDFRILDVACGDDDFIYELAAKAKFCVGNDIHWEQIRKLAQRESRLRHNIVFTNHDACYLPFKLKFDLSICKNLLHHVDGLPALNGLLDSLQRVSHRILIVDPEDPQNSSKRAKIWNYYYRTFLKDQGQRFYSRQLFEEVVNERFGLVGKVEFRYIKTIKGTFMFAHIDLTPSTGSTISSGELSTVSYPANLGSAAKGAKQLKALIFDLDGLLVDTEKLFFRAMREELAKREIDITEEQYIRRDLQNGSSLIDHLFTTGLLTNREEVVRAVYDRYRVLLMGDVQPMRGALEALRTLRPLYRLAIASSSRHEFIEMIIQKLSLSGTFEVLVGREDTRNQKPDPECLRVTLSKLQLGVSECLLIEDSMRGMRAAQALGMKVIVVPNQLTANGDFGDTFTLDSLRQLTPALIRKFEE